MISRWAFFVCASALFAGGCCGPNRCGSGCGPGVDGGRGSLFCRSYEQRMADSDSYNCGHCNTPVGCCNGGIKGWLNSQATGCKGCGDMYWGEWVSDPPDCCDPCNKCGDYTGNGGTCCKPNCLARLSRLFNGHRYCPGVCGDICGVPLLGCNRCGGAGCDACGGQVGHAGQEIRGDATPRRVLDQNWDPAPSPLPTPGKPIHKASTPSNSKVGSGRMPGSMAAARRASYESWR
jgi:hypothetical protein